MGKITGFMEFERQVEGYTPVEKRVRHYKEFTKPLKHEELENQGARCMSCGIPFCHSGCPLGNLIPDFNDLVYRKKWKEAAEVLHSTNNFPEFTGRLCPAPCEEACVLGINQDPVSIETIEKHIVEEAFANGWINAEPPVSRTGKTVAVIGSGPAGLAAAQQLNRAGHLVTVFERDNKIGGLLRYGIPDFKLEKQVIDRRIDLMKKEGIQFKTNAEVGKTISASEIRSAFDAVLLATGSTKRRSLAVEGSDLKGVVQAMDFLKRNNEYVDGIIKKEDLIDASGKDVIVIGGGDTGSDCIGTSNRHGAKSVTNFEILNKPGLSRSADQPWPFWPMKLKTSSSHEEGAERFWSISTKAFLADENGKLNGLKTVDVQWVRNEDSRMVLKEVPNSEKIWKCDLVLLALGFTGPENSLVEQFRLDTDQRSNIKASTTDYMSSVEGVFAAGDARRGQSLIVWAISEGRQAAHHIDAYLMGESQLPLKGEGDLPRI